MASQPSVMNNDPSIAERLTKVETVIETERPHLATKADLERHTRLLVMWMIATQIAASGFLYTVLR